MSIVVKNYYKVLGLERDCSPEDIKKNYRILVKNFHPDVATAQNVDYNKIMALINEAYSVLSNPSKKLSYDQMLSIADEIKTEIYVKIIGNTVEIRIPESTTVDKSLVSIRSEIFKNGSLIDIFNLHNDVILNETNIKNSKIVFEIKDNDIVVNIYVTKEDLENKKTVKFEYYRTVKCKHCTNGCTNPSACTYFNDVNKCTSILTNGLEYTWNAYGKYRRMASKRGIINDNDEIGSQQARVYVKSRAAEIDEMITKCKFLCPNCHGTGYDVEKITKQIDINENINNKVIKFAGEGFESDSGTIGDLIINFHIN